MILIQKHKPAGVYTSEVGWKRIMGKTSIGSSYPLWYILTILFHDNSVCDYFYTDSECSNHSITVMFLLHSGMCIMTLMHRSVTLNLLEGGLSQK